MKKIATFPLTILFALAVNQAWPADANAVTRRKAAIFVENRAGAALNDKVPVLEDLLTGRLTEKGFSIISREVAINALNRYLAVGFAVETTDPLDFKVKERQTTATGEQAKTGTGQVSLQPDLTKLDRIMSDSTSALRLAQNLAADYLLVASITTLGTNKTSFTDGALKTVNLIHTLRVSYKLLDGVQAGSLIADTVKASKTIRQTENLQTEAGDLLNELLDEAAVKLAANVGRRQDEIVDPPPKPGFVAITVSCGMTDLAQLPLSVPDIRLLEDGSLLVLTNRLGIQVLDATVEIDGIAIGSAPGKFQVRPGLSKMRITREGFKDWERTANFSDGQKFHVALQMSEEGYRRWKDNTEFLFKLETGQKLTEAGAKMMEGFAQFLRESRYRIDHRSDVKADIEAKGKSPFDGLTIQPTLIK